MPYVSAIKGAPIADKASRCWTMGVRMSLLFERHELPKAFEREHSLRESRRPRPPHRIQGVAGKRDISEKGCDRDIGDRELSEHVPARRELGFQIIEYERHLFETNLLQLSRIGLGPPNIGIDRDGVERGAR